MENNIYKSIQEWFELKQQGIITEKEFQDKKAELLNTAKKQTIDSTNKSQSKEIKPIENSSVENSSVENIETLNNTANIESNKIFELISNYKFYIIFTALVIVMTISYFKNFYNAGKNEVLDLNAEIEKWKKELYLNKEVGPECIEDYAKWAEDNPDYYFGLQETKTIESDFNSDGINDYLVFFPAVNCVGGNGRDSDFGLLVYSDNNDILTNKNLTKKIAEEILLTLRNNQQIYAGYINFHYQSFNKKIGGNYYAYLDEDASCCPSFMGKFEYDLENGTATVENKKTE